MADHGNTHPFELPIVLAIFDARDDLLLNAPSAVGAAPLEISDQKTKAVHAGNTVHSALDQPEYDSRNLGSENYPRKKTMFNALGY